MVTYEREHLSKQAIEGDVVSKWVSSSQPGRSHYYPFMKVVAEWDVVDAVGIIVIKWWIWYWENVLIQVLGNVKITTACGVEFKEGDHKIVFE